MKRQALAALMLLVIGLMPAAAFNLTGASPKATEPAVYLVNAGGTGTKAGEYAASSFSTWPPQGWTLSPASGTGAWGQGSLKKGPDFSPDSGALGTLKFAEFNSFDWPVGTVGDMISPTVTLPNPANDCSLSYYTWNHWYATAGYNYDTVTVSITTNGGSNWTVITKIYGDINDWTYQSFPLGAYAGQDIQIKFHAWGDYGASDPSLDEVKIGRKPAHEAGLLYVTVPANMIAPTAPEAQVINNGSGPETFAVACTIDSLGTVVYTDTQTVSSLASGAQQAVLFSSYAPVIGNGNIYTATFNIVLAGDADPYNDTLITGFNSYNARRSVYVEDFTAQWCGYCPYVQNSLQQLKTECGDSIIIVGVHPSSSSDSFYTQHSKDLETFYGTITGYPTSVWDGVEQIVGGWTGSYGDYRTKFDAHKNILAPFSISLDGTQSGNTGSVTATIDYPGMTPISGNIKMVIIEESKYCKWPSPSANPRCDSMREFLRDMFPSSAGDAITINNGSNTKTINFTLNAGWNKNRLDFLVYVNNMTTKEIYNAYEIAYNSLTGVEGSPDPVGNGLRTQLLPCFPNPGSDRVNINYNLQSDEQVSLAVYDITGRMVQTLVNGKQTAGSHSVAWNGCNERGQKAASGIYFYKLTTGSYSAVKKLTLLK